MHDNDPQSDSELEFDVVDPQELEQRPIGLCTLADIITHLDERYDGILVSAINHGDEIPMLTALWGRSELRQKMLNHAHQFDEVNPADADDEDRDS